MSPMVAYCLHDRASRRDATAPHGSCTAPVSPLAVCLGKETGATPWHSYPCDRDSLYPRARLNPQHFLRRCNFYAWAIQRALATVQS
jgi:hypothetical protein